MLNICWFGLFKCKCFMLVSVICDSKLNIFEFWTVGQRKHDIWRHDNWQLSKFFIYKAMNLLMKKITCDLSIMKTTVSCSPHFGFSFIFDDHSISARNTLMNKLINPTKTSIWGGLPAACHFKWRKGYDYLFWRWLRCQEREGRKLSCEKKKKKQEEVMRKRWPL